MLIIMGRFSHPMGLLISIAFTLQQMVGIFLIHFVVATFTNKLHKPSTLLCSIMVHKQWKVGNFGARFRLVSTIYRLHTKMQYGLTYGAFGLITVQSFTKVPKDNFRKSTKIYHKISVYSMAWEISHILLQTVGIVWKLLK